MIGAQCLGATLVHLRRRARTIPTPTALWELVERHRVTLLGVSPTLIRAAARPRRSTGSTGTTSRSLRILGSTGEPWDPDTYRWLSEHVGGGALADHQHLRRHRGRRRCFLSPLPGRAAQALLARRAGARHGRRRLRRRRASRSAAGSATSSARQPWPAMTSGRLERPRPLPRAPTARRYPGVWRHGDWAKIDEDGHWFLSAAPTRRSTSRASASARPRSSRRSSPTRRWPRRRRSASRTTSRARRSGASGCRSDGAATDVLAPSSRDAGGRRARQARSSRPGSCGSSALPKTRSAKILRRAVRAVAVGEDPGDLSTAENPEALEVIRGALAGRTGRAAAEPRGRVGSCRPPPEGEA